MQLLWLWGPAIAMMALIYVASSLPATPHLPGDPSNYTAHLGAYAVLAALVLRALARARWEGVTRRAAVLAWLITALYGVSDEVHQRYVPNRYSAVDDWVADGIGAAAAILTVLWLARRKPSQ
jgi:VanZ family protein